MFEGTFPGANNVRSGASIRAIVDGIEYTATIHRDDDAGKPEDRDEGFWPSLDPSAPGWIGNNPRKPFDQQMAECEEVMRRYRAGKMIYCGVVVTARKAGIELVREYECALWGVDINWPHGDNGYLVEVANELFEEARAMAQANLAKQIERHKQTLAALTDAGA